MTWSIMQPCGMSAKLDDWMSDFYIVARIALKDQPQLLEALGKKCSALPV